MQGIAARRDLIFAPLLEHTIAQQKVLARTEARAAAIASAIR